MVNNRMAGRWLPGGELQFVLANDPALIPAIIARLHEVAVALRLFDAETAAGIDLALHEALFNALHHGNLELDSALRQDGDAVYYRLAERRCRLEPYRSRRVHVRARLSPWEAVYIIRDEGPGFDPSSLPDPTHNHRPSGRGLLLIRFCMDEVTHNPSGNEITLIKRRKARPPGPESEPREDSRVGGVVRGRTTLVEFGAGADHRGRGDYPWRG